MIRDAYNEKNGKGPWDYRESSVFKDYFTNNRKGKGFVCINLWIHIYQNR